MIAVKRVRAPKRRAKSVKKLGNKIIKLKKIKASALSTNPGL